MRTAPLRNHGHVGSLSGGERQLLPIDAGRSHDPSAAPSRSLRRPTASVLASFLQPKWPELRARATEVPSDGGLAGERNAVVVHSGGGNRAVERQIRRSVGSVERHQDRVVVRD